MQQCKTSKMYVKISHATLTDYLDGNVPQHSISLVETLTVSELIRVVMLHFRDTETPCHEHRSWYTGYTRLGTIVYENRSENDGTIACVSQTILNITEDTFTPKLDVIYSRVNGDYSTVKPICIENETAYYIKLQRGKLSISDTWFNDDLFNVSTPFNWR